MNELKCIRWQQRFANLQKAFFRLQQGKDTANPSDLEIQGIIQSFEFTFELAWKTIKDYLEAQGVEAKFPREALKQAFQHDMIEDGVIWLEMLAKRNLLAHTYDEDLANEALSLIVDDYFYHIERIVAYFASKVDDE